jgi:biopolymer transport protein ExbD
MIDVVFLLMVFFMLAARFGQEVSVEVALAGGAGDWSGPPRLVDIRPEGLALNGVPTDLDGVAGALPGLMTSAGDTVVLRARDGADVQRVLDVMEALRGHGFTALVLVE